MNTIYALPALFVVFYALGILNAAIAIRQVSHNLHIYVITAIVVVFMLIILTLAHIVVNDLIHTSGI